MDGFVVRGLDDLREVLTQGGARMVLLTTPCLRPPKRGTAFDTGLPVMRDDARVERLNAAWREYASLHPNDVTLLDLSTFLCPNGKLRKQIDGEKVHTDGVHFSPAGARLFWNWLTPQIADMRRQPSDSR